MGGVMDAAKKIGGGIASAATGNPMGLISGALGVAGGISSLTGGGPKSSQQAQQSGSFQNQQTTRRTLGEMTPQERAFLEQQYGQFGQMNQQLGGQYNQAAQDYQAVANQFRDALTRFSTGTSQPTAEQLAQATSFVDQTFTAPAQAQYTKFLEQANTMTAQRAAAQGRSSLDSAIQQQFTGAASEAAQNLTNQRANLIAQRADELSFNRPQQQLAMLGQGAQFFNAPLQSAIGNRLALLNAGTQQQNLGLERQLQTGSTSTSQSGISSGSASGQNIGAAPSLGSRLSNLGGAVSDFGRVLGPMNQGNQVGTPSPETTFGSGASPSLGGFQLRY